MRRKQGTLVPLENKIIGTIKELNKKGIKEPHGYLIASSVGRNFDTNGTVYRALKRLEQWGYITSKWEEVKEDINRPRRRLYKINKMDTRDDRSKGFK